MLLARHGDSEEPATLAALGTVGAARHSRGVDTAHLASEEVKPTKPAFQIGRSTEEVPLSLQSPGHLLPPSAEDVGRPSKSGACSPTAPQPVAKQHVRNAAVRHILTRWVEPALHRIPLNPSWVAKRTVAQMQRLTTTSSYTFAAAAVAACAVVRWLLNPLLENEGLYLAFMIPVAISAFLGGAGPGSLSAVLSAAIASPYLSQFPAADAGANIAHLLLFGTEAGAVVALMQRLHDSRSCAEQALASANTARQAAEDATRAREEFMARVSHDWRGPLNTIAGWLWQLDRRSTDANFVQRATASMKRAVESQSRFVSDLLDYSRGAQGKLSLEPQRVPICEPVKRAMEATGVAAVQHQLTMHISEEDSDARVWGDPVRLQQVFTNLLENATKFTPPGGSVAIEFVTSADTVEVKVTDTGVGISPDVLPMIFEPFAQSQSTRDAKQGGLGLGLSIAKDIIDLHGGSLFASSAGPGTGTTFVVRLPLAVAPQTQAMGC